MSSLTRISAMLPNKWYKVLLLFGGFALLVSLISTLEGISDPPLACLSLGLLLLGIAGWWKQASKPVEKPAHETGPEPAPIRPEPQVTDWLEWIVTALGFILLMVGLFSGSAVRAAPAATPYSTETPYPTMETGAQTFRIAIFTYDGTLGGSSVVESTGAMADYLESLGNTVTPFAPWELESLSDSFGGKFDLAILATLGGGESLSRLLASGLAVITTDSAYADDLGLGTATAQRIGNVSVYDVVDNTHPVTAGLPVGPVNLGTSTYLGAIDSREADSDPLIVDESPVQTELAVHKTKPYAWFGWSILPVAPENGTLYRLLARTVAWACARRTASMATAAAILSTTTATRTPTPTHGMATDTPTAFQTASPTATNLPPAPTQILGTPATPVKNHIPGNLFSDASCGITFEYPLDWIIELAKNGFSNIPFTCFFGTRPKNYQQIVDSVSYYMSDNAITLGVVDMRFLDAAEWTGFVNKDGTWYISGRQGMLTPAYLYTARGLSILKGQRQFMFVDKQCDCTQGWGEADWAVISDGGLWSIVMYDDTTRFQLHFEYILQTIGFLH
jgi:hypothetical protein